MAKQTRTTLKGHFETGDIPTQGQYADLIDSHLILDETNTGILDLTGNITASGNISSSGTLYGSEAYVTGHITASGLISQSGATGTNILSTDLIVHGRIKSLGSDVTLENGHITASGTISASSNLLAAAINSHGHSIGFWNGTSIGLGYENNTPIQIGKLVNPTTFVGHVTASGNISASGNIEAGDYKLDGVALSTTFTELNYLDGISSAQGGYVKAMDQSVATTDIPTFAALNIGKVAKGGIGAYGGTIIVPLGGKAFTFTLTGIPTIAGINSGQISKTAPTLIQNASVGSTDAIIINCTNQQLSVTAFGQSTAAASGTAGFYINISNDAAADFTAGTAQFTVVVL